MTECLHEARSPAVRVGDGGTLEALAPDLSACERCYGTGWPVVDGRATRCSGGHAIQRAERFSAAQIPGAYRGATIKALRETAMALRLSRDHAVKEVGRILPALARGEKTRGVWLHSSAPTDNRHGKTWTACSILRHATLDVGACGRFVSVRDLLQRIRETYSDRSGTTEGELVASLSRIHVLVLDDVRRLDTSSFEARVLGDIIEARANGCGYLTIVTSNPRPDEIASADDWEARRIVSRLRELCAPVVMPRINPELTGVSPRGAPEQDTVRRLDPPSARGAIVDCGSRLRELAQRIGVE